MPPPLWRWVVVVYTSSIRILVRPKHWIFPCPCEGWAILGITVLRVYRWLLQIIRYILWITVFPWSEASLRSGRSLLSQLGSEEEKQNETLHDDPTRLGKAPVLLIHFDWLDGVANKHHLATVISTPQVFRSQGWNVRWETLLVSRTNAFSGSQQMPKEKSWVSAASWRKCSKRTLPQILQWKCQEKTAINQQQVYGKAKYRNYTSIDTN